MDMTHIHAIPPELMSHIFGYLSFEDLTSSVQFVSGTWQAILHDSIFWKEISFKPPFGLSTENVVALLKQSPFLVSFESREGLKVEDIFNTLCEHNPKIVSLAFDSFEADTNIIEKLIKTFPNLEYLQLPITTFATHIPHLGKLRKLKKVKCLQVFNHNVSFDIRPSKMPCEDSDWCALEALELYSEHSGEKFDYMMLCVRSKLLSLEMQTVHNSRFLEHIQHCVRLETLKLNFMSRQIQGTDFGEFFSGLKKLVNLKHLQLSSFVHSDANILCKMFDKSNFPQLIELNLVNCSNVSPRVFQSIAAACPQLEKMCLKGCVVLDDTCLHEVARCVRLSVLDISGCTCVTERGVSYLTSCIHLRNLNISWIGLVSSPMLGLIAQMKRLETLKLDHTEISIAHLIDAVVQLPVLKLLSVYQVRGVNGEQLQEKLREFLPHCFVRYSKLDLYGILKEKSSHLQSLNLNGPDKKVLRALPYCQDLRHLSIDFLGKPCYMFAEVFTALKSFGKLHTLALKGFVATEHGVLCNLLEGLPQLGDLDLENCCSVDKEVAIAITNHNPKLEKLRLKGCVGVTNDALSALVKIQNLCLLDISGCSTLTETGLLCLSQCNSLTDLNLCGLLSEAVNVELLNTLLSSPKLCKLHLENHELLQNYMTSKNWVIDQKFYGGKVATYVPSIE